jgi:hypothetical protein
MGLKGIRCDGGDWIHLAQGQVADCSEHGNKPSDCMKNNQIIEELSDCHLLKEDFTPWN